MIRIRRGIELLSQFHGGQQSGTYSVMSSLMYMADKNQRIAPETVYHLPFLSARDELIAMHRNSKESTPSKDLRATIKWLDDWNAHITRASISMQAKLYYRNSINGCIWTHQHTPWCYLFKVSNGLEYIYVPNGAGLSNFNLLLGGNRIFLHHSVYGGTLITTHLVIE